MSWRATQRELIMNKNVQTVLPGFESMVTPLVELPIVITAGADLMTVGRLEAIFIRTFNQLRRKAVTQADVIAIATWVDACHGIPAHEQYKARLRKDYRSKNERDVPCTRCGGKGRYREAGLDLGACYRCKGSGRDVPGSSYPGRS